MAGAQRVGAAGGGLRRGGAAGGRVAPARPTLREVGGGAGGGGPRLGEGQGFGVRAAAGRGHAGADDAAVPDNQRADAGVRRSQPEVAATERQSRGHEARVVAHLTSGSASNSPTM